MPRKNAIARAWRLLAEAHDAHPAHEWQGLCITLSGLRESRPEELTSELGDALRAEIEGDVAMRRPLEGPGAPDGWAYVPGSPIDFPADAEMSIEDAKAARVLYCLIKEQEALTEGR